MKKRNLIIMFGFLSLSLLTGCGKNTNESVNPSDFEGSWGYDRVSMEIEKTANNSYTATIDWSSSASESSSWSYECNYEEDTYVLSCIGSRIDASVDEDGNDIDTDIIYLDGEAEFSFIDGKIKWNDKKEDAGEYMLFERITD